MTNSIKVVSIAILTLLAPMTVEAQTVVGWSQACGRHDDCVPYFLRVVTSQGNASLSVQPTCDVPWVHIWQEADARQSIQQWLDAEAEAGRGELCIPLNPAVNEIRIVSVGGHCSFGDEVDGATASLPDENILMQRRGGTGGMVTLSGCHASIAKQEFGGIALDFADGYSFGDSYAESYFYGVYDSFEDGQVSPFGASVYDISQYNTYHYRVQILANGQGNWTQELPGDQGR